MIYVRTKKTIFLVVCCIAGLAALTGCNQPDHKADADETVYKIIDQKWQNDFGDKSNYKISDTEPSPRDIQIEKTIPKSGILTMPQAVALATAHNRQYQREKEALYIKALDLRLARHQFDPQFFGGPDGQYSKDDNDEAVAYGGNLGFEQLLAGGARISTNVTAAWIDILTGNMRSGLTTLLSTTITQPLLRGSNRQIVRENLTQAERDTLYQIRLFNRFRKTFVVSIISQYYEVLRQCNVLENARENYNILLDVYKRAENLANAGRLPRFELDQADQDKLQAWDVYIEAEKEYSQALDNFKIALSLPVETQFQLDKNELTALGLASPENVQSDQNATKDTNESELLELIEPKDFSESDIIETALALRLDLANKDDAVYDAKRKVIVAADSLEADLNLTVGIDVSSSETANSSAFGSLIDTIDAGLQLDLPLERMAEANEYRKALITLTQQLRDYQEAEDLVALEVRQAYRDLNESAERYRVHSESLKLARKRFENTFLLLQYARANTRDVLDAQDDLFDAQNAATESLVNHAIATLSFYRDTGVLQLRPDGMWKF